MLFFTQLKIKLPTTVTQTIFFGKVDIPHIPFWKREEKNKKEIKNKVFH